MYIVFNPEIPFSRNLSFRNGSTCTLIQIYMGSGLKSTKLRNNPMPINK